MHRKHDIGDANPQILSDEKEKIGRQQSSRHQSQKTGETNLESRNSKLVNDDDYAQQLMEGWAWRISNMAWTGIRGTYST